MKASRLAALALLHAPWTLASLAWCALARRRGVLTLAHAADVDAHGKDAQMGPLVQALTARGERRVAVVLVPLAARAFFAAVRRERGPFLSLAVLLAAARALSPARPSRAARARVAGLVLRACAPRVLFLIDESGSGQMLVAAARARGLPSVGIQHGDFQPRNAQYAPQPGRPFAVEPADVLCVWSPWFQERLLARSPLYTRVSARVTGRLASASPAPLPPVPPVRVLVLAEAGAGFAAAIAPFLDALRAADGVRLSVRAHPSDEAGAWPAHERAPGSLHEALGAAHVAVGIGSSALLEALRAGRPAIVLAAGLERDPAGYVAAGVASACETPSVLAALCRRLAYEAAGSAETLAAARIVWGGAPSDPVTAVLGCDPSRSGGTSLLTPGGPL